LRQLSRYQQEGILRMGKRGPNKSDGTREANGRLSRKKPDLMRRLARKLDAASREAMRPGVEARHLMFGFTVEESLDQMAGSAVGRLCMAGKISDREYEAACTYWCDWQRMVDTIAGPKPPSAIGIDTVKGVGAPENEAAAIEAVSRWRNAQTALQAHQDKIGGRGALIAALSYCVLRDGDHPHMLDWLREALLVLAMHYKIGDNPKPKPRGSHPALTGQAKVL
jgi:hypothetical protein